jgi:hypothetical protein
MDGQEDAIRALTVRLDAVEGQVGTMAAKIDRFDHLSDKLDDLADSLQVIHRAAELITRGKRFWGKVLAVIAVVFAFIDVVLRSLPALDRIWP